MLRPASLTLSITLLTRQPHLVTVVGVGLANCFLSIKAWSQGLTVILSHPPKNIYNGTDGAQYISQMQSVLFWSHKWNKNIFINSSVQWQHLLSTGCLFDAVSTTNWEHWCLRSLHGCALLYLSDTCKSAPEASRRLRSSGTITCVIPWSRTRLGDRLFDVAGPRLWNKLPASLRSSDSLCQFRRQLKTFLFIKD